MMAVGASAPVPILRLGRFLIAPIHGELTDSGWRTFRAEILERSGEENSVGVVVDVSAMPVIDSYAGRSLSDLAQMLRLRGVAMAVAGIQPDVAFAMVRLGLELSHARTVLDLEDGLAALGLREAPPSGEL